MDILEAVGVAMPCGACSGQYEVTMKQVLIAHEMLHEGCPVSDERECPPLYRSHLADEQLARDLQRIWQRLEDRARKAGGGLTLLGEPKETVKRL